MENKNMRNGPNQKYLPRLATPMISDILKRGYQTRSAAHYEPTMVSKQLVHSLKEFQHNISQQVNSSEHMQAVLKQIKAKMSKVNPQNILNKQIAPMETKQAVKQYKTTHRAFRNKKVAEPVSGFTKSLVANKKYLSNNRALVLTSMCLVGASYYQRRNGADFTSFSLSRPQGGLKSMITNSAWSTFKDCFQTGPVQYIWGNWWCLILQKSQIHDALIYLLLQDINKHSFVQDSIEFGKDWIENCLVQQKVIDSSLELVDNTFLKSEQVQTAAVDLCSWFVQQEQVQTAAGQAYGRMANREDSYDVQMWQLSQACVDAGFAPEVMTIFSETAAESAQSKAITETALSEIKNVLSLGSYNFLFGTSPASNKVTQTVAQASI